MLYRPDWAGVVGCVNDVSIVTALEGSYLDVQELRCLSFILCELLMSNSFCAGKSRKLLGGFLLG